MPNSQHQNLCFPVTSLFFSKNYEAIIIGKNCTSFLLHKIMHQWLSIRTLLLQNKIRGWIFEFLNAVFMKATTRSIYEVLNWLLWRGTSPTAFQVTPLMIATFKEHLATIKYLVKKKAAVNAKDRNGVKYFVISYI